MPPCCPTWKLRIDAQHMHSTSPALSNAPPGFCINRTARSDRYDLNRSIADSVDNPEPAHAATS